MSAEQEFNSQVREVISRLSQPLTGDVNNNQSAAESLCDLFVFLKQPVESVASNMESLSLNDSTGSSGGTAINDLRLLLLVNFIGKLFKKRFVF